MDKKHASIHADRWLEDVPARSEPEGFKPEQMTNCPACGRKSPPTRPKCLYCGAPLPVSETQSRHLKLDLRKLEDWEKGFNLIYVPGSENKNFPDAGAIAKLLHLETEDLNKILETGKRLPLARVGSEAEAEVGREILFEKGVETRVVADENLRLDTVNRRLRAVEFLPDKIIFRLFNTGEEIRILPEDLRLIVVGTVFERKIESTESVKRKKENKVEETAELSTDELIIDLYTPGESIGCRIESNGFDFSGLRTEKSLLAAENMQKLTMKLQQVAPGAVFDDDYRRLRAQLTKVWEIERRTDSGGVRRSGMGGFNRKNVTVISNSLQFMRYSRLQQQLL